MRLVQVTASVRRHQVREQGGREDEVERLALVREAEVISLDRAAGIVPFVVDVDIAELEIRELRRDVLLGPLDQRQSDVEALIAGGRVQVMDQGMRHATDPASCVQHVHIGSEASPLDKVPQNGDRSLVVATSDVVDELLGRMR